ncbi:MAG TPA: CRTAC1 family protein [Opitutaceae bacterium]|nr:CRTAC1 family protein [Opitutaceae bacterium]
MPDLIPLPKAPPARRSARACVGALILCVAAALSAAPAESTQRMARRLAEITAAADTSQSPFDFTVAAKNLNDSLLRATDKAERLKYALPLANALTRSGRDTEALQQYENFARLLQENGVPVSAALRTQLRTSRALCHLRIGERANCLQNHNADSCLFPIAGGGVHQDPRGSRGAIAELLPQLEEFPGDLRARWLLNIAYMTVGEYPAGVPEKFRIDPRHFASGHDIKRFPDVAGALGLDVDDLAGGVVMDDFDRDGCYDLMVSAQGLQSPLRYFRNNGDGSFTELTEAAGLTGLTGGLNLIHGDYDNDGLVDVLVLRGGWLGGLGRYPVSLLRNHGNHTFTDVTEAAGLLRMHPTQTAAWFDYDADGHLDLFIGNESEGAETHPCELFRNNGNGTFTDIASESGVAVVGYVKAVVAGDYNNDGRPDLFLSRRDGANHLFRNDGPAGGFKAGRPVWRFTDVAAEAGVVEPYRSFSCWFFDYDNDGWIDLHVNGYYIQDVGDIAADVLGLPHGAEKARLFRNNRDGTFSDVSRAMGVHQVLHTMGCNFGDLDNDGWLDFYAATGDPEFATLIPSRMFRSDGGRRFQDVTTAGGFGQLQKGHGVAFGDIDNDGDQDVYSVVGGAITVDNYHNQLFANPGHGNGWLKLQLEGVKSNRPAIGARVKAVVRGPAGERELHRTVGSGGSFGASPFRVELGLGDATEVVRVEVRWPAGGPVQVLTGLEPRRAYRVREGAAGAVPLALRTFALPEPGAAHHHHHHR